MRANFRALLAGAALGALVLPGACADAGDVGVHGGEHTGAKPGRIVRGPGYRPS